jgi:hypothetical protein
MNASQDKIAEVKKRYEKAWLELNDVVGVGIGLTTLRQPGIIISVKTMTEAIRRQIPDTVEGVVIEICETGEISAI